MVCPKCGSANVTVAIEQTSAKTKNNSRGCLWSICRGLLIFCTCGLWLLVGKSTGKSKTKFKNTTVCLCQNCAHKWSAWSCRINHNSDQMRKDAFLASFRYFLQKNIDKQKWVWYNISNIKNWSCFVGAVVNGTCLPLIQLTILHCQTGLVELGRAFLLKNGGIYHGSIFERTFPYL